MCSAARLIAVTRCSRSTATIPVPTEWKIRSVNASRSRRLVCLVSSSARVERNRSASPPATMATTRKVPAFRKIVTISSAVLSLGVSKKAVSGSTVRPKTRPV